MPKQTFYNLPEDKQVRIREAAIDEFAEKEYNKASINSIIEKAGIPKGSFYQYFEDKKDLYIYILDFINEKKMEISGDVIKMIKEDGFYGMLYSTFIIAIKFFKEKNKLALIGNNFMKYSDEKFKNEIIGDEIDKYHDFLCAMIDAAKEKGDIRKDIETELLLKLIVSMSYSISETFMQVYIEKSEEEIMKMVEKIIEVMKNGLMPKEEKYDTDKKS